MTQFNRVLRLGSANLFVWDKVKDIVVIIIIIIIINSWDLPIISAFSRVILNVMRWWRYIFDFSVGIANISERRDPRIIPVVVILIERIECIPLEVRDV